MGARATVSNENRKDLKRDNRPVSVLAALLGMALLAMAVACTPSPAVDSGPAPQATAASAPAAQPSPTAAPATPSPVPATAVPAPSPSPTARATSTPAATPAPMASTPQLEGIMSGAASVRGLASKGSTPLTSLPREGLRSYLVQQYEKETNQEDLQKERATLMLLDLLKESDDLHELSVGLLSEQIVGFYDLDSREMRLVGAAAQGPLAPLDELTLAHEYVHALQDQHFDLANTLEKVKEDSERSMALRSLTEGDATLAMTLYARQKMTPEQFSRAAAAQPAPGASDEKLRSAPLVLQISLLFPYENGAIFAASLFAKGGWAAVDRTYANPPTTTEQVMHPEKYLAGEGAKPVQAPDVSAALGTSWALWDKDVLGELGAMTYLQNGLTLDRATKASTGWGGDQLALYRSAEGKHALVAVTDWDSTQDATEFFDALRSLQNVKPGVKVTGSTEARLSWSGGSRFGRADVKGTRVTMVIGPEEAGVKGAAEVLQQGS